MRSKNNTKKEIKQWLRVSAAPQTRDRIWHEVLIAHKQSGQSNPALVRPDIWRTIMKSPKAKLTAAAVILGVAVMSIILFKQTAEPVWAVEQTVKALRDIKTLVITGDDYYSSGSVPFKCYFRLSGRDGGLFDMRYESEMLVIVVRDTKAWEYRPKENFVRIYKNVTDSGDMMRDLGFWYKVASLNPWLTGKILGKLKLFTDDWKENYGRDERTGRDCVFVKCSYEPLSFLLACDLENKLIVEARYWTEPDHKGPPSLHATGFSYNQEISDEVFDFQIPEEAKVIYSEREDKAVDLYEHSVELFKQDRFADAIESFQNVREWYPEFETMKIVSLTWIAKCYDNMGQFDKAIDSYKKCIEECPPDSKARKSRAYCLLGFTYMKTAQNAEALEAFKNCLDIGREVRDPDWWTFKQAGKYIKQLESQH